MAALFIGGFAAAQKTAIRSAKQARDELALVIGELKNANAKLEQENAERTRIHEKLRYSEAFLTEGQRISHTGSWHWHIEAHTLDWSEEHYRIFGYPGLGFVLLRYVFRTRPSGRSSPSGKNHGRCDIKKRTL